MEHLEGDFALGKWVRRQRWLYRLGRLEPGRAARLEALSGWVWEPQDDSWQRRYDLVAAFVEEKGHARVPDGYEVDEVPLGGWVGLQRTHYKQGKLSQRRARQLERLPGWTWDMVAERWERGLQLLTEFAEREGHVRVPRDVMVEGFRFGRWVNNRRYLYREGRLSLDQIQKLESVVGWFWDPYGAQWEEGYGYLQRFVDREGHSQMSHEQREDGFALGRWVIRQRAAKNKGRCSAERAARLESLPGWTWDSKAAEWDRALMLLQRFADREGHLQIPIRHSEDGVRLHSWATRQRQAYKSRKLGAERINRLGGLSGWNWEPYEAQWEAGIRYLEAFVIREGHARVPPRHLEDDFRLGSWAAQQRQTYRAGKLSRSRVRQLRALPGWSWKPRRGSKPATRLR